MTPRTMPYRYVDEAAEAPALGAQLDLIYRARVARAAAGAVLGLVAAFVIGSALFNRDSSAQRDALPLQLLLAAWPLALLTYALARAAGRLSALVAPAVETTAARTEQRLYHVEVASIALPLVGLAFAAPLTLHAGVAALFGNTSGFGAWMALSGMIVGHAHLALALHGWFFARALHRTPANVPLQDGQGAAGAMILLGLCGTVPGVVLLAIPPLLVLVTGTLFVPLAYLAARRTMERERADVARALRAS